MNQYRFVLVHIYIWSLHCKATVVCEQSLVLLRNGRARKTSKRARKSAAFAFFRPIISLMSNTPKLSRIVLKQRRFESARGSKTSDSPEVRLAELDLPEVRSRINAQGGEKFWRIDSNRLDSSRFVFLKVDSTQRKSGRKVLQVCARDTIRHNKERITWTFLVLKASLMQH